MGELLRELKEPLAVFYAHSWTVLSVTPSAFSKPLNATSVSYQGLGINFRWKEVNHSQARQRLAIILSRPWESVLN